MNKTNWIFAVLPIIIIIIVKYSGKFIDWILWDESDEYGFDISELKRYYNEAKNCGYTGTLKDYIKMVGVKEDDDA